MNICYAIILLFSIPNYQFSSVNRHSCRWVMESWKYIYFVSIVKGDIHDASKYIQYTEHEHICI